MSETVVQAQRNPNLWRYLHDPAYHHAVDLLTRLVIGAVEEADRGDESTPIRRTLYERRERKILETLLDARPEALGYLQMPSSPNARSST